MRPYNTTEPTPQCSERKEAEEEKENKTLFSSVSVKHRFKKGLRRLFVFYPIPDQELVVDGVGHRIHRIDHPKRADDRGRAVHRVVGKTDQFRQNNLVPDASQRFCDSGNLEEVTG